MPERKLPNSRQAAVRPVARYDDKQPHQIRRYSGLPARSLYLRLGWAGRRNSKVTYKPTYSRKYWQRCGNCGKGIKRAVRISLPHQWHYNYLCGDCILPIASLLIDSYTANKDWLEEKDEQPNKPQTQLDSKPTHLPETEPRPPTASGASSNSASDNRSNPTHSPTV